MVLYLICLWMLYPSPIYRIWESAAVTRSENRKIQKERFTTTAYSLSSHLVLTDYSRLDPTIVLCYNEPV
jgi:hypothetical protein